MKRALLVLLAAALAAPAAAHHEDMLGSGPAPDPVAGDCLVASGRDAVAALGNPACATLLLDGVVSIHDADFPHTPVHRPPTSPSAPPTRWPWARGRRCHGPRWRRRRC